MILRSHPAFGLGIVMLSGTLTASFPLPMKFSREWRWENTWFVYATLALVIIPLALAGWAMPHLLSFYSSIPRLLLLPLLFGFGWGIAQVTFGLAIAQVGMAMAFAIVIGLSSLLGSIIPLAVFHPKALTGKPGMILLASAALLIWGLVFYARAGRERDSAASASSLAAGGAFLNGLLLCIFTGCFGSMINMGFVFGGSIARQAVLRGVPPGKATLCVWAVVLAAGYIPNAVYTLYLLKRNRSAGAFQKRFFRETLLALAAAVLWLFGMLGYGLGAGVMGIYGNSIGFAACMTVLLLWSSALGIFSGEWRAAPLRARSRMRFGLTLITASMLTLGFGSLLY